MPAKRTPTSLWYASHQWPSPVSDSIVRQADIRQFSNNLGLDDAVDFAHLVGHSAALNAGDAGSERSSSRQS